MLSLLRRACPLVLLLLMPSAFAATNLNGMVVGIADGDTLTLLVDRQQHRIRLAEIDTPERGQDWGARARQALADKVFERRVRVETLDVDRYGRIVGRIWLGDRDINREMVAEGHAWVYRDYLEDRSLLEDERRARAAGLGLWGLAGAVAPWEFRRGGAPPTGYSVLPDDAAFSCGGKRYCREMRSCAEARFHLRACGLTRLDGDGDGIPCEALCRP